jgi:hypothetical protein
MEAKFKPGDRFAADTTAEAARVQIEIYRRMAPEQRLQQAFDLSEFTRELSAGGVRARHPDYTERQVQLAVIRLVLGDELYRIGYPDEDVAV